MEKATLNIVEAGRLLGIGRNTAYKLAKDGTLPALRLGRRLRIPTAALEELLRHPQGTQGGAA